MTSIFAGGATASSVLSADAPRFTPGSVEINGTEGTLVLGDPSSFGGGEPIRVSRPWKELPITFEQEFETIRERGPRFGRGVGVLTMARTLRGEDLHIATGQLGYHVLDAMVAIEESAERHEFVRVSSTVDPIPLLPTDFDPFVSTLEPTARR